MFFLDAKYSWEIFKFYFFQKLVIYVSIIVRKQQLIFKKNINQKSANPSWESNINICFLKGGCKLKKIKKVFSRKYGTLEKEMYFFDWSTFAQERGGEGKIDKHLFWSILVGKQNEKSFSHRHSELIFLWAEKPVFLQKSYVIHSRISKHALKIPCAWKG